MFRKFACLILGYMAIFAGCSGKPAATDTSLPPTNVFTTPSPFPIVIPSAAVSPTAAPTPTATSILPDLATVFAPFDQNERITRLLREPLCNLPCIWNITPGATTWDDADSLFGFLGLSSKEKQIGLYTMHEVVIYSSEQIYKTSIEVYDRDGIVEYLAMTSTLPENDFRELYGNYEPKKVLKKYGLPDRIFVFATSLGRTSYSLDLFYDKQGFLISYGGRAQGVVETGIIVCPDVTRGRISGMGIYTQSQKIEKPIEDSPVEGLRENFRLMKSYSETIEEATGLTIREFSDLFVGDTPTYCFTILK